MDCEEIEDSDYQTCKSNMCGEVVNGKGEEINYKEIGYYVQTTWYSTLNLQKFI